MEAQDTMNALITTLKSGGIAVVRTDTLYGVVALAQNQQAVEKVYTAKKRDLTKQCIVLIASADDAPHFNNVIKDLDSAIKTPITIIVPATSEPDWLLRGGDSLAYRVVRSEFLQAVIREVGPIIAPSANIEGQPPARNISQAQEYFGTTVDTYVDGGEVPENLQASTIVKVLGNGEVSIVRE